MKGAGLPGGTVDDPDLEIAERAIWRFVDIAATKEGIEDLGFQAGARAGMKGFGRLEAHLRRMPTLYAALESFCGLVAVESSHANFSLLDSDGYSWFVRDGIPSMEFGQSQMELYCLMTMIDFVRAAAGARWLPPVVKLQAAGFDGGVDQRDFCAGPVQFRSSCTAISFPNELLGRPMDQYRATASSDEGRTAFCPAGESPAADFAAAFRAVLPGYLDEPPTLMDMGDITGFSPRSIQRYLADCGTSYKQLLDQARFELAARLIKFSDQPLTDVGFEVGYSDPAHFTRAFRRWAGMAPRQYRTLHSP
jgi:AraC-like DNA-binding protein